jgi:hypothetical protein
VAKPCSLSGAVGRGTSAEWRRVSVRLTAPNERMVVTAVLLLLEES